MVAFVQIASTGCVSQSIPSFVNAQWSSNAAAASLNVNPIPQASPMLPNLPFGRPGALMTSPPAFPGSNPFSNNTPRHGMSAGPAQINPGIHPHMFPPYHSLPGTPQGMWLQPLPMGPFPGSYQFPVRGISLNLPHSGSQPLGPIPTGSAHALPGHQLDLSPGQKTEALSGIGTLEVS